MKKVFLVASLVAAASFAQAGVVTSFANPALAGATVDGFSAYATGSPTTVGNGAFVLTQNGGGTLTVTDTYAGVYGAVGRSVVSYAGQGVTFNFTQALDAFAVTIGGADYDWKIEAFGNGGGSLGTATVAHNVEGFIAGWAAAGIWSVKLSPTSSDAVLFDNLSYVQASAAALPEPTPLALIGVALLGLGLSRRRA